MFYQASAPGSLIIIGEYAVLHDAPCLVAAINKRIYVTLIPRHDSRISIFSSLAHHQTDINTLNDHPKLGFVMECLKQHTLPSGCDIHIRAEFSSQLGLGSSAAVTAALCHTLAQWCNLPLSVNTLWERGISVIRAVQGSGSGADLAASCMGGLTHFQQHPFCLERLEHAPKITTLYSGKKQSTTDAIKKNTTQPDWNNRMASLSKQAVTLAKSADWNGLSQCMTNAHALLVERGVSTPTLQSLVDTLDRTINTSGAKISGSGYGDCVIALGSIPSSHALNLPYPCRYLPISITQEGVTLC